MPPKGTAGADAGPSSARKATDALTDVLNASGSQAQGSDAGGEKKKKKHRAGKKRRNRRQSFAAPSDGTDTPAARPERPSLENVPEGTATSSTFYRLGNAAGRSGESIDSEILLDHRSHQQARARRSSTHTSSTPRPSQTYLRPSGPAHSRSNRQSVRTVDESSDDSDEDKSPTDRTPLISNGQKSGSSSHKDNGYGIYGESSGQDSRSTQRRKKSRSSSTSDHPKLPRQKSMNSMVDYDVNNPPSVPGSPRLGAEDEFDDVMLPEFHSKSPVDYRNRPGSRDRDAIIDIDTDANSRDFRNSPRSPVSEFQGGHRRRTTVISPREDVCLPFDRLTEAGDDEFLHQQGNDTPRQRRHRKKEWPDLQSLEEWSQVEAQEQGEEGVGAQKISEPVLIGGRLRPQKRGWSRQVEEAPYRWTYFNEELDASIRSRNISGLQQLGMSFRELFIPDPPELEESSSDEDDSEEGHPTITVDRTSTPSRNGTRQSSILEHRGFDKDKAGSSGEQTPRNSHSADPKPKRYGPRPVFWLDVLQPTYEEMRIISRAFGIHKLTAEDIMEQEAREKVELFRNYYFVNYRTFEQDETNEEYMEAVNMYFVVFKGGVLSFHFSQMPHPANVRRRIRQLAEHQYTDSDWISYAIIDNITDAYAPIIEQIEKDVDDIDDEILQVHSSADTQAIAKKKQQERSLAEKLAPMNEKMADENEAHLSGDAGKDMLLRVGECRKKVMGLYRLLGNKADVIKGLAKRCNEQWEVAPRSDVGLYLGDIQDHIVTMTANLTHYENILSRAHSNYLAQISIGMNERAEQTADVLGKLTVLGTIVLPMNIVTGLFGMNCLVPGQDVDNLWWFFGLTGFLFAFGFACYAVAKRVYHLV